MALKPDPEHVPNLPLQPLGEASLQLSWEQGQARAPTIAEPRPKPRVMIGSVDQCDHEVEVHLIPLRHPDAVSSENVPTSPQERLARITVISSNLSGKASNSS